MKAVVVDKRLFEPIRVTEERLETLLATAAPSIFSGFDYFTFKPAIRCGTRIRHPDGALLAPGRDEWWVVEVETHLHDIEAHIEPQLSDLMNGMYGPDAFKYLDRHDHFNASRYDVDTYEPAFLLVIDTLTHEVQSMAARLGIPVAECSVYFAADANQFALALSGFRPHLGEHLTPGICLRLGEIDEMALLVPADGRPMPPLKRNEILIGDRAFESFRMSGSRGIVLPLEPSEIEKAIPGTNRFRLITKSMKLVADPGD